MHLSGGTGELGRKILLAAISRWGEINSSCQCLMAAGNPAPHSSGRRCLGQRDLLICCLILYEEGNSHDQGISEEKGRFARIIFHQDILGLGSSHQWKTLAQ